MEDFQGINYLLLILWFKHNLWYLAIATGISCRSDQTEVVGVNLLFTKG